MEFLNPAALYSLLLLPLLVLPYLIRRRPRPVVFSSLLLLREFAARVRGGRSVPPIFFLHLLLLALLLLALGEPSLPSRTIRVAIVLDNSASMQAKDGGRSRFQAALDETGKILRGLPAEARVDLYSLAPDLARIGDAALPPERALARAAALKPLDVGERALDHGAAFARLARERGYERLYFVTDHPAEGQSRILRIVTVGGPANNLALTSFEMSRAGLGAGPLEARLEVRSFSKADEKFQLNLKAGGKIIATRAYTIAPGKTVAATFDSVASYPFYEAEIATDDALPLDDRRFAVAPPAGPIDILAVSPRPAGLDSLRAVPGVQMQIVAPETYGKGGFAPHAFEIFQYSAPLALPEVPALFILPPAENPLVRVAPSSTAAPVVTAWREDHPLTRYINFSLFRPAYARPLKPGLSGQAVIDGADGALAVAWEQNNRRYVALGFDPLPFLGRQNLPMSIFTLNLLQWLSGSQSPSLPTGAPLDSRLRPGETLLALNGDKIDLQANAVLRQGIYRTSTGRHLALNLDDPGESDLRTPAAVRLHDEAGPKSDAAFGSLLWPYFLIAALALLLLEWFINPLPRRPQTETVS